MKISVVGAGYVGVVLSAGLAKLGHEIILVDIEEEKVNKINEGKAPFYEKGLDELISEVKDKIKATLNLKDAIKDTELTFICVGTPSRKEGYMHTEYIKAVCMEIGLTLLRKQEKHYIVIKSTVLPGTTEECIKIVSDVSGKKMPNDFSFAMNPEFLREGNAVHDFFNQDRIVIGSTDKEIIGKVKQAYQGLDSPILETKLREAEMIKYANNAFLATKISFINEIGNICKKFDIDTNVVAKGIGMDFRIGPHFLRSGIGFGGSCFPKDVSALAYKATEKGYAPRLLNAVLEINRDQPMKLLNIMDNKLNGKIKGKNIAILGLSFKADTDDTRESPSLQIIKELLLEQANLHVYDPSAMEHVKKLFPHLTYSANAQEAIDSSDIVLLLTEWPEFENLDYKDKHVLDGKNVFDADKTHLRPKNYEGICW
ncbi:MAG: UDP-glucose/GDP-mannose dehydrogenase family protein [Nanoarchaeota archaeon]|nr:UDP-glucose/GDP-mannose dehydrogenase family protein [Nanoarchaeota archaeon]